MRTTYAGSLQVHMVGKSDANPTSGYNTPVDESARVAGMLASRWPVNTTMPQTLTHTLLTHTPESAKNNTSTDSAHP